MKYTDLKIGDCLNFVVNEFDCVRPYVEPCIVSEFDTDHAIAKTKDGEALWIDEYTIEQFERR